MKKKLVLILSLVLVLSLAGSMLIACNNDKGLTDEQLTKLLGEVQKLHGAKTTTNENFGLIGLVTNLEADGTEISCEVKWTTNSDKITIATEKNIANYYSVTIPDREKLEATHSYTVTGTLVNEKGEAYTKEDGSTYSATFNYKVTALSESEIFLKYFLPDVIGEPAVGTEYNLGIYNPDKNLLYYFNGKMESGKYFATTEKLTESVKVKLVAADGGGFYISFDDNGTTKYLTFTGRAGTSSGGKATPYGDCSITTEAKTVFNVNSELNYALYATIVCGDLGEQDFYLGSQSSYTTISATSAYYVTDTNAANVDVTQCVGRLIGEKDYNAEYGGLKPVEYTTVDEIIAALKELAKGKTLPGGPYTLKGTITVIVNAYDEQYGNCTVNINVVGTTDEITIQCYRMKGGQGLAVGDEITVTGTLKNFNGTIEFDTGCTYVKAGETPETPTEPDHPVLDAGKVYEFKALETPAAGNQYIISLTYNGTMYYANGEMKNTYYFGTVTDYKTSAVMSLVADGSGWLIKQGDRYVEMTVSGEHINLAYNKTRTEGASWTWDATNKVFTWDISGEAYVIGSYKTYTTLSAVKLADVLDSEKTEWAAYLGTLEEVDLSTINYGSEEAPISVEAAIGIAGLQCLAKNDVTEQIVYVTGKVVSQPDYSGSYIKQFTLADINDPNKTIIVYTMNKSTGIADPDQNDTIVLCGYIKNYDGTKIQFATANSTNVQLLSNTRGQSAINVVYSAGADVSGAVPTTNGQTATLTITAQAGKKISSIMIGGVTQTIRSDNTYTVTVHGDTSVIVLTLGEGEDEPVKAATITLGSNNGELDGTISSTEAKYKKDGYTFVNNKGTGSDIVAGNNTAEQRCYQNSTVTISAPEQTKIVKLVFNLTAASYAAPLEASLNAWIKAENIEAVVMVSGTTVTLFLAEGTTAIGPITMTAQVRMSSVDIYVAATPAE